VNKTAGTLFVFLVIIVGVLFFLLPKSPSAHVAAPSVLTPVAQTPETPPVQIISPVPVAQPPAKQNVPEVVANSQPVKTQPVATPANPVRPLWDWRALAATNLELALKEAMELPDNNKRTQILAAICYGVGQNNPADAIQLAQTLHLDQQPGATLENLVQQWGSSDMASALTWADQQPAGAPRDAYMTRLAFILSQSDPSDAASLVTDEIPTGQSQDEAIMVVVHQWASQSMPDAIHWLQGLNSLNPALQQRAIDELQNMQSYR
jgi:hypothetical protein